MQARPTSAGRTASKRISGAIGTKATGTRKQVKDLIIVPSEERARMSVGLTRDRKEVKSSNDLGKVGAPGSNRRGAVADGTF